MLIKSTVSALAFAAFAPIFSNVAAADSLKDLLVSPAKAINLDVGVKRAIGYYLAHNGACDLTLLLSDAAMEDGTTPSASRISVSVAGGTSAQVDTIDGAGMSFTCSAGATEMKVRTFARVAQSPYRSRTVTP